MFTSRMFDNKTGIIAFAVGFVLISAVLLITPIHGFFKVEALSGALLAAVYGIAFGSMIVIQAVKACLLRSKAKK